MDNVLTKLGVNLEALVVEPYSDDLLEDGLRYVSRRGKVLATIGIVSRGLQKKFGIDNQIYFADIVWTDMLKELKGHKVSYSEISKYPEVKRDLALLIDKGVSFADIVKVAKETERKLLKDVYLFDVYEGANLLVGKKSYAVSFILQDENKTLTDVQIDAIMNKLIKNFDEKLDAKIR